MKYLQRIFKHSVTYSIILKNDKLYRISHKRNIQRKIKDDIKDIRKYYTNDYGIWNLKGIENKTIEYYNKNRSLYFTDDILLERINRIQSSSSLILAILFTPIVTRTLNEVIDIIEKFVELLNSGVEILELIKILFLLIFYIVVSAIFMNIILRKLESVRNTKSNYLDNMEIMIIKDILEKNLKYKSN